MFDVSSARSDDVREIQAIYVALRRPKRPTVRLEDYLVARHCGSLVGCAAVQLVAVDSGLEGYLYGLAVRKEFQRKGIGAALTEARIERVQASHGIRVTALAMFWNVAFFKRLGFETVKRHDLLPAILELPDFVDVRYRRSAIVARSVARWPSA
jgi:N-acetylglutamate synthase-like GNAT family acetyltransferase